MNWPKEVPILKAKDICKGRFDGPNNTHCLAGWAKKYWPDNYAKIWDVLNEMVSPDFYYVYTFNDNPNITKKECVNLWNQCMANLGYTEGNPMKPTKKTKYFNER